jgi:hypothetical protein
MLFGIGRRCGMFGWLLGRREMDFAEKEEYLYSSKEFSKRIEFQQGGKRIESHLPGCELSAWR